MNSSRGQGRLRHPSLYPKLTSVSGLGVERNLSVPVDESLPFEMISCDPGPDMGWCRWEIDSDAKKAKPLEFGHVELENDELLEWLCEQTPKVWVAEQYLIAPPQAARGYKHRWDKGETLQVQGMVRLRAHQTGSTFVLQQRSVLVPMAGMSGVPQDKGKSPFRHATSAYLHGYYFCHKAQLAIGVK